MSMVSTSRTQRRDKSTGNVQKQTQATAEEIRLAQIISNNGKEEDTEMRNNVAKVIEVTGTTEDNARTALYDANNDTSRAIEIILENGAFEQTNEWETAGRKKNKNVHSSVRGVDTFDEEIKEEISASSASWEKNTTKGRGRGRSTKSRGKSNDLDRRTEEDSRGGFDSWERPRGGRRGRGRGFSGRGGRNSGRGPKKFDRYNQNRDDKTFNQSSDFQSDYQKNDNFGTFSSSTFTVSSDPSQMWPNCEEDWGLEVGTWSNDDAQKQSEKKNDPVNEPWGTGSWADDLAETKVFQSQNAQMSSSPASGSLPSQQNHIQPQSSAPQMGERIDIGALFKKNHSGVTESGNTYSQTISGNNLIGQPGMVFNNSSTTQPTAHSVIQQLQQQGQSNSLFSDNKTVNDMDSQSSRLFGAYERQGSGSSVTNQSTIPHYSAMTTETSYSQYNGKLAPESNDGNSSALLGSFAEQFKSSEQTGRLGHISDLTKSAFTSLKPMDNQGVPSSASNYRNFSQAQQREATEAVKASLGLSAMNSDSLDVTVTRSGPPGMHQNEGIVHSTLSFGAPQPARQQKQQRKKTATVSSKIPASAVEMPGTSGGGYLELSTFDLQFGADDNAASSANDFSNPAGSMSGSGVANSNNTLFNNSVMSSPASLINHINSGGMEDPMFASQIVSQNQQSRTTVDSRTTDALTSATLHNSQRYSEPMKSNEPLRGPPGITHPQSLSTPASSGVSLGSLSGNTQPPTDLSSSGASYNSGRIGTAGNMSLGGLSHETSMDQSSNISGQPHSFYTSASHNQQSQQHMVSDLSGSGNRNLRSPVPTSSLPGSIQASPMSRVTGTPSKDNGSSTAISSLTSGLTQTHITPHGGTPTKQQVSSSSTPISILGSSSAGSGYASMNMGYNVSSGPSMQSQSSSTPAAASPGKHLSGSDLYTSASLSSSLPHSHQPLSSTSSSSNSLGTALGSSVLSNAAKSKAGPPNLSLGVPPILPSQYGIPMGPGLMTAYTPDALYGYTDQLMAVQSRVHQMQGYYDMYNASNASANASSLNRESSSSTSSQGKFGRGEPSSPTSLIGITGSGIAQQQLATGQHNAQLKVSQTGTHQAQPFMNLPTAAPAAAYPGYGGLYYNAFQYPPMFAAAVPNAKHQVNATTAFQQPATGFSNAYSTASINASSASNLHDLQGQGYSKSHVAGYEKQQAAFHHHTNTPPPFNIPTLTAAMAASNTGAAAGAGPGISPYTQAPFMTMLPTHQHSQIHLHLPQHGDAGQTVGSQRSQGSNPMGKTTTKAPFGGAGAQYWGN